MTDPDKSGNLLLIAPFAGMTSFKGWPNMIGVGGVTLL